MRTVFAILCAFIFAQLPFSAAIIIVQGPIAPAVGGYTASATNFAGDSQCWLERDGTGTGVADSATGTISFWVDPTGSDTGDWTALSTNNRFITQRTGGDDRMQWAGSNTAGTAEIELRQNTATVATLTAAGGWSWVAFSFNNNTAGACYVYIANAATSWVATDCTTRTNDTGGGASIDFTDFDWAVGAANGGGAPMPANLSEVYVSQTYYDLSSSANRDLFYNSTTHGPAGDLSAVGSPIWYLKNAYTTFTTNSGSGGDFVKKGTTALADGGAIP